MSNIVRAKKLDLCLKHQAFPYQQEAFESMKDKEYCGIFHEQGLGKTKIAIDLMTFWFEYKQIDTVLIVTKKQLISNWINEIDEHTFLKCKVLSTDKKENFIVFNSPSSVIVTNFETVSSELERIRLFLKTRYVAIIIDESTKLKNPYSKVTQDFFAISNEFRIRVIMTGTPIANRPYDIWAQIFFLDKGIHLGTDFEEFKKLSNLRNDFHDNERRQKEFEDFVSLIYSKISNFVVRETKDSGIITLPNKVYKNLHISFEDTQKSIYTKIKNEMNYLIQKNDNSLLDESDYAIKRLLRLVQTTSNPRLIDDFYGERSGKEVALEDLILEITDRNEQAIVWSIFIDNINYFSKYYSYIGVSKVHGGLSIKDRDQAISDFKSGKTRILFATPQSAKEGLTLTNANHVIFYDRGFSLDDYLQAQDRIHRISQTKICYIYNLIIEDSIDEWIDILLDSKQKAAALAQGDITLTKYRKVIDYSFGDLVREILNSETEGVVK